MKYTYYLNRNGMFYFRTDSSRVESVPTQRTVSFKCSEIPDLLVEYVNYILCSTSFSFSTGGYHENHYEGVITDFESVKDKLLNHKDHGFTLDIEQDYAQIQHEIRPYLYNYKDIEIVCDNCESKVKRKELGSDVFYDGEEEYFSGTICPICGEIDCCELEYETIYEALIRKNK